MAASVGTNTPWVEVDVTDSAKKSFGQRCSEAALVDLLLPVVLPLLVVGLVLHVLNRMAVCLLVWIWWLPAGKDVLFVSSDSPVWQEYMQTEILPLVAKRAIVLNWSERSRWSKLSFSVRVFHTFGRE